MPIVLPAPGRFSTTIGCPSCAETCSITKRAITSVALPGVRGNDETDRLGWPGPRAPTPVPQRSRQREQRHLRAEIRDGWWASRWVLPLGRSSCDPGPGARRGGRPNFVVAGRLVRDISRARECNASRRFCALDCRPRASRHRYPPISAASRAPGVWRALCGRGGIGRRAGFRFP